MDLTRHPPKCALAGSGDSLHLALDWLVLQESSLRLLQVRFLGVSPTRSLNSNPSHRENHNISGLTLEYMYQDWVYSVANTCAVDSMLRCTQGI